MKTGKPLAHQDWQRSSRPISFQSGITGNEIKNVDGSGYIVEKAKPSMAEKELVTMLYVSKSRVEFSHNTEAERLESGPPTKTGLNESSCLQRYQVL